jgi:group I intron endonuclease
LALNKRVKEKKDRAKFNLFKRGQDGGLRSSDSSSLGQSVCLLRGHHLPNLQKSHHNSITRNGSFNVRVRTCFFSTNSFKMTKLPQPEKVYENADHQKLQILKENKGKSGVYRWVNKDSSGKSYVGSSVNLRRRFTQYFSIKYLLLYSYMAINRALLKYGYSNFYLTILEYCDPSKCIEREQYYINHFKPEYNISPTAGAPMTDRNHSEETKKKISESRKGILLGKNHPMFGINRSEETKQKISESRLGRLHSEETLQKFRDRKFSEETKKKMSESLKGRLRPEGAGRPSVRIEV